MAPCISDGFRTLGFRRTVGHRWGGPLAAGVSPDKRSCWTLVRAGTVAVGILALVGVAVAEIHMS